MTRILFAVLSSLLLSGQVLADDALRLPLWRVAGEHNDVYLLASVHLLRASDYPLPAGIYDAYEDAEQLVMELDMDDLDPADAARVIAELGVIQDGSSLATLLGDSNFARASELASGTSVPLAALAQNEPWFAAITIEQFLLTRLGFDPALGLENHLMQRAVADGKNIGGLETLREQLEILDQLPLDAQRRLFMNTLEEGHEIEGVMNGLIDAWARGDIPALEATALHDLRQQPELYKALVVRRNDNWVTQIESLLQQRDDFLVVVGALHLVGDEGVPVLLKEAGYSVQQLEQQVTP